VSVEASVIIPTAGRPEALRRAVKSLLAGNRTCLEILVIDNGLDESTSAALRASCAALGAPVRYIAEPSPGATAARHRGAKEARGELLLFTDDDVRVSAGWVDALASAFADPELGIAGGPSLPDFSCSVPAWLWDFLHPSPYGGWACGSLSLLDIGRTVENIDPVWLWSLNLAIRRDLLRSLGGFHPDLMPAAMQRWQGDGETGLARAARAARAKCRYVHEALLWHVIDSERLTAGYFARRARFQAICDSFARIREGNDPRPHGAVPGSGIGKSSSRDGRAVSGEARAAYVQGWRFHQQEAERDPRLLAWIRRDSYWDADVRDETRAAGPVAAGPAAQDVRRNRLGRAIRHYASKIAPRTTARIEARAAFRNGSARPILVYQMGKVGSTTVVESLSRASLPNAVLHLHAISDDVARYRREHLAAGAGVPYHLELGAAVAAELSRGDDRRCKIISLVRDPIAVQISSLFEVPEFASPEMREGGKIDAVKAAASLRKSLAEPRALDYIFDWFDREVARVFGIDVFAHPFPKAEGVRAFRGEGADMLLLRLEDLDRVGPEALARFLGLPAPLELVRANVRAGASGGDAYRELMGQLTLDIEVCDKIYSSRFARHFYDDAEISAFTAKWCHRGP
jgi:glucosyl-dolichyl phosphate glucuronosyltransferase